MDRVCLRILFKVEKHWHPHIVPRRRQADNEPAYNQSVIFNLHLDALREAQGGLDNLSVPVTLRRLQAKIGSRALKR